MSQVAQRTTNGRSAEARNDFEALLGRPIAEREVALFRRLDLLEDKVRDNLPAEMKAHAAHLVKRLKLTVAMKFDLADCAEDSICRALVEAAELGMAIDGKLCYLVPFRPDGAQKKIAQLIVSYQGLVALCRRAKSISQVYTRLVLEGDDFEMGVRDGLPFLNHVEHHASQAQVVGAYAIIRFSATEWVPEYMDREALEGIAKRSKAKNGPWSHPQDRLEMMRKCPLRRALKLYVHEHLILRALDLDREAADVEDVGDREPTEVAPRQPQVEAVTRGRRRATEVRGDAPAPSPAPAAPSNGNAEPAPEQEILRGLWNEWQAFLQRLTREQQAECAKAAGVAVVSRECDADQFAAAIERAGELVKGAA